jgi:hypothetical protein
MIPFQLCPLSPMVLAHHGVSCFHASYLHLRHTLCSACLFLLNQPLLDGTRLEAHRRP